MKGASCSAASSVMSNSYLEHPFRHLEHAFSTGFLQIPYGILKSSKTSAVLNFQQPTNVDSV